MKLFGNKRGAAHVGNTPDVQNHDKKRRLTGVQRGVILLVLSVLILCVTVVAVYKSFVKPVEIKQPEPQPVSDTEEPEEETFRPPTVTQIETKVDQATGEEVEVEVEVPASHREGVYNILVAGTDDDGTRTDTIMIAHLDTIEHSVALLSVPRDTLISGNYSVPKINSVYGGAGKNEKGMEALKRTLASILGFEVDGYALVNLDAFIELVDLVDGVDFDVPMRMYYSDPTQDLYIDLQAGMQHLNGEQAMGLVRFRKGYATQDIQRTQTQQAFLKALAKKYLSVTTLSKLGELADIFYENVLTDLTVGNIAYFGQELLKCNFDEMYTHTLEGEAVDVKGASCYALYLNKTLEVVNEYFNPYDTDITSANVSIRTPSSVNTAPSTPAAPAEPAPEPEPPEDPDISQEPDTNEQIPQLPTDSWVTPEDPVIPADPLDPSGGEELDPDEFWP